MSIESSSAMTIVGLLGLICGSFVNAYVYRIHIARSKQTSKNLNNSIITGRSYCPKCKHILSTYDLIPVISWIFLKGKCRYCKGRITAQYPLIELLTTVLFIISYKFWPYSLIGPHIFILIFWLLILTILIAAALYDYKYMILPNSMLLIALIATFGYAISKFIALHPSNFILNSLIGFTLGGGIFYIIFQISAGKWIGGGDVKLGAILGLILGSGMNAILMIFISSLLGVITFLPLSIAGKMGIKKLIPYGPFLIAACIILVLTSGNITDWLRQIGAYPN